MGLNCTQTVFLLSHQVGEEKKELNLGQSHPLAHEVRDETLILDKFFVLNEAFRVELSWVCPGSGFEKQSNNKTVKQFLFGPIGR